MQELSPKQSRFFNKWTIQRKNKWQYRFLHGSVYWMILGLIIILTTENFKLADINPLVLLLKLSIFAGVGLLIGNNNYKSREAIYQKYLLEDDVIGEGVLTLIKEKIWTFENLTLTCNEDELLVIRNNLFWLNSENPNATQLNDCINVMLEDVKRLQGNISFQSFFKGKKIKIQLFNNLDRANPLIEKQL
ncbi:MAG: hypothetical protein WCI31_14540 [Prolixibacteraceae bacterium]